MLGPLARRLDGRQDAAAHHADRVAHARAIPADSELTKTTAFPGSRRAADQLVNLRLAADVDAARRFIEQEDARLVIEQPAKRDLLLVAAGEFVDGLIADPCSSHVASPDPIERRSRVALSRNEAAATGRDASAS